MLTALIIISLLSLLIATEAEPANPSAEHVPEPLVPPKPKPCSRNDDADRMAA